MKKTIERIFKMNEVLVDVLVYLDSTKQSNTLIRSQVDTIVNFEKLLKEDSNIELESYQIKKRAGIQIEKPFGASVVNYNADEIRN